MKHITSVGVALRAYLLPWCALFVCCDCASPPAPSPTVAQSSSPSSVSRAPDSAFWSERNATVAIPREAQPARLVYLANEISDDQVEALRIAAPNVEIVVGLSREAALARAADVHACDASYATAEFIRAAPRLRWVQARSAGVDRFLLNPELTARSEVVLTNAQSVHGPAIADHAFAMLLALTRDIPGALADMSAHTWDRDGSPSLPRIALADRTLLVVGLGGIGSEIAVRGRGFGMRVIATRRSDTASPEWIAKVGKPEDLALLVGEADVIAVATPLTAETKGLISRELLAKTKRGAYLLNIARGKIVDTDALVDALRSGQLAGAGLDVTDPEPLPPEHVLWTLPNVIITPHVAGDASITEERAARLFRENVRRFGAGEPLVNVVDKKAGY